MTRTEVEDAQARVAANPMNRLVPYLDLFGRLSDVELARLAVVAPEIAAQLRGQIMQVQRGLRRYVDLLPRLSDDELVRLTGATNKTIRFWRLCQPRDAKTSAPASTTLAPAPTEADAVARAVRSRQETAPHPVLPDAPRPHPIVGTARPVVTSQPAAIAPRRPGGSPTPAAGTPAMPDTAAAASRGERVTPGLGSPAFTAATPQRPTPPLGQPAAGGAQPPIDIEGTPFPGFDYDPNEPIPDELSIGVDLPDPY